jgi:hypothetical protein
LGVCDDIPEEGRASLAFRHFVADIVWLRIVSIKLL